MTTRRPFSVAAAITLSLGLGLGLAACSPEADAGTSTPTAGSADQSAHEPITFERAWGKATDTTMSGVFGILTNHTDEDVTLERASSPVADLVELHETVMVDGQMLMREVEGGFVIPAGQSREFIPGEDHIMLMELTEELLPGQLLPITLTFSDDTVLELELDIREYAGANEEYADLEHHHDHDHDHDGEGDE